MAAAPSARPGRIARQARAVAREVVVTARWARRVRQVRSPEVVNLADDPSLRLAAGTASPELRADLAPGATFTASVGVTLDEPLAAPLPADALRVVVGVVTDAGAHEVLARSHPARNEPGDHRVSVTFTVPRTAAGTWLRLSAGDGPGGAAWHCLCLTATDHPVPYFDGSTEEPFYDHRWLGTPGASASVRTARDLAAVGAAAGVTGDALRRLVADEVDRACARGDLARAASLARALAPGRWGRRDPLALVAASRVARAAGREVAAVGQLRRAVRLGDPDGDAAFELGRVAQKRRWWRRAVEGYRTALERRPEDLERGYRLAHALGRVKETAEAKKVLARTVARDPDLPFDGAAVSERVLNGFSTRREVALFLVEELDTIRRMAQARPGALPASPLRDPVFVYWGQGLDAAPPLVRACVERLRAVDPAADVHVLDDATLPGYVDLPPDLLEAVGENRAHLSDLIRIALLERHGGTWLDATCWVTRPLTEHVPPLLRDSDFFAFTYKGAHLSSWFLSAHRGSYVVRLWRAAMWRWWELRGEVGDYFLLHHVFEMLHELDERFRKEFARCPRLASRPRHHLQHRLLTPYDEQAYRELAGSSFVHKLTYKLKVDAIPPGTVVAHLLDGSLPRL